MNRHAPLLLLILCLSMALSPASAIAQSTASQRRLGAGGQAGNPTGLTVKYYSHPAWSSVALGSWNLEHFLEFSIHVIHERPIPDSPLRFFIGPGLVLARSGSNSGARFRPGFSLLPGLNFFTGHFEVFLQTNPGVRFDTSARFTIGGAVGLRYFF